MRDLGLELGFVDVKVAAIDATWSGLKFVRRLRDREGDWEPQQPHDTRQAASAPSAVSTKNVWEGQAEGQAPSR